MPLLCHALRSGASSLPCWLNRATALPHLTAPSRCAATPNYTLPLPRSSSLRRCFAVPCPDMQCRHTASPNIALALPRFTVPLRYFTGRCLAIAPLLSASPLIRPDMSSRSVLCLCRAFVAMPLLYVAAPCYALAHVAMPLRDSARLCPSSAHPRPSVSPSSQTYPKQHCARLRDPEAARSPATH
jgi:hypothetical protein